MHDLPTFDDPNLLVGAEHFSDAGVYRIDEHTAIVQTVDFFPPLVDDPFVFGQIAAANSLSDVYAMGGRPRTALNIVGFPDDKLPLDVLQNILRGGADRMKAAGGVIVGGHSVRDTEIKYGLAVTGIVDPQQMLVNERATPGDVLVLTKALGTGFITTALRAGRCPDDVLKAACASMVQLNEPAAQAAVAVGARAATDITGFGLAGHATEFAVASGVSFVIELERLPRLPGADDMARRGHYTRANPTNRAFVAQSLGMEADAGAADEILYDPQTSGGLLIAVGRDRANELVDRCREGGMDASTVIGTVIEKQDVHLIVRD